MIDKIYINYNRYIAIMIMMIITILTFKKINIMILKDIKRNKYNDFKEKFKTNNKNRR